MPGDVGHVAGILAGSVLEPGETRSCAYQAELFQDDVLGPIMEPWLFRSAEIRFTVRKE